MDMDKLSDIIASAINSDESALPGFAVRAEEDEGKVSIKISDLSSPAHENKIPLDIANIALSVAAENARGAVISLHPDVDTQPQSTTSLELF